MTAPRAWAIALGYMAGIFALSSIPGGGMPESGFSHADKLVHFAIYAGLGALLFRTGIAPWACVAIAVAYGASDELHQRFTPGRGVELADAVADAAGASTAVVLLMWAKRRQRPRT